MIQFNELRITPDSKYLIIDVAIKDDAYFENSYLTNIKVIHIPNINTLHGKEVYNKNITAQDIEAYVSGNSSVLVDNEETVYVGNEGVVKLRILLSTNNLGVSLSKSMFKVQVSASELPENLPENYASNTITAVVVDLYPFYRQVIKYLDVINCSCENKTLIDLILRFKSLEMSTKVGNFELAAKYWFKYFDTEKSTYFNN